ncbi:DUF5801 repeats-in-toxin domain-containing protein [Croceicoccus marinus]|uniref:DUF5801 domain-containing protein n=1 Tax=Croceicoccus marinus TaxID=450378 RepID=A0A1Z1F9H2_9SPHN|nr:DUF5801 repeats-in-toxin domain-containing protein [Croceicoccus marinus]ARU15337.1 hypothetical protein A9D14_03030 [Croceicoccus marinus]
MEFGANENFAGAATDNAATGNGDAGLNGQSAPLVQQAATAAFAGTGRRVIADADQVTTVVLPEGTSLDDLRVDGENLIVTLPDGTQMVIVDAAIYDVDLVVEGTRIPDENWKDYLGVDEQLDPEAGGTRSSGGNFADPVIPLDPAYDIGNLLPYTELQFPVQENIEVGLYPLRPEQQGPTPPGSVPVIEANSNTTVDESGLPARDGDEGFEPAGTLDETDAETSTGTIRFGSPDGVDQILIDGVPAVDIVDGQPVIVFQPTPIGPGVLTIVDVDLTNGTITYSYTLTDNTDGGGTSVDFDVTILAPGGGTATGNVVVTIIDDVPVAVDDGNLATLPDEAVGTVIGTVGQIVSNDDYGADGPGVPAITIGTGDRGGTITIVNGELVYTPGIDVAPGETVVERFTYTITDGDGSVSNEAEFTVTLTEGGPALTVDAAAIAVDEDGLPGGLSGGEGDIPGDATTASGTLQGLDFGSDGTGDIALAPSADTGLTTIAGNPVETVWDTATHTLTGQDAVTGEAVFTLVITDVATGSYEFTLLSPIAHPAAGEDNAVLPIPVTVTDADGDSVTGTIALTINDDSPSVTLTGAEAGLGVLDESPLSADGIASATVDFSGSFDVAFGADGAGDVDYALALSGSDVGSGLFTLDGTEILLNIADGVITGSAGGTDYFTIGVDAAGKVTFAFTAEYANVSHGDATDPDDVAALVADAGAITLIASATDADGDTANAAIDLGTGIFVIQDDGPVAANDTGFQVVNAPITIDVFANDSAGTDGVDMADGIALATGPAKGVVSYNGDGSFTYTANPGAVGGDSFTYTITDADGDTSTATVTLNIAPDTVPTIVGIDNATVDEDGLPMANADSGQTDPAETPSTGMTSATGSILVDFGLDTPADAEGAFAFTGVDALDGSISSGGQPVDFALDASGNIVGTVDGGATTVITVTLTGATEGADGRVNYDYEVTLQQPVDHPVGGSEDAVTIPDIGFTVTDSDGSPVTGSFTATITDDVPTAETTAASAPVLVVDDSTLGSDASADFAGSFDLRPGADGTANTAYALGISAAGADSGLTDTATGEAILLYLEDGTVVGRVGGEAGAVAFTVDVDTAGIVTLDQQRAIAHDDPADPVEAAPDAAETLASAGLVTLTASITDGDGDTAGATLNIGQTLLFEDDGPAIAATAMDDGISAQTSDAALPDSDAASLNLAALFGYGGADFGADGSGSIGESYALTLLVAEGSASGLTSGGEAVNLFVSDDGLTVTGSTSASEGGVDAGNTVFTVTVGADGTLTLSQAQVIDHAPGSDAVTLADGLIGADYTVTITDGDGDSAADTASIDLGGNLTFTDDVPLVEANGNVPEVVLDESLLPPAADGIYSVTADFSAQFDFTNSADGPNTTSYALNLSADGMPSGLSALDNSDLTAGDGDGIGQGDPILLSMDGGDVVGMANGTEYFRISLDPGSGEVTFSRSENIWHAVTGFYAQDDAQTIKLPADILKLTATITDADGDSDSASVDLGQNSFTIEDAGPSVGMVTKYTAFNLSGTADYALVANGTLDFEFGTDGPLGGSLGTGVAFVIKSTSSVDGIALTQIDQPTYDPVDGVWKFAFDYVDSEGRAGSNSGEISYDGDNYQLIINEPFEFTTVTSVTGAEKSTAYDAYGLANEHKDILTNELDDGTGDPFFVQITGFKGGLNAGGDNVLGVGERVGAAQSWISTNNTAYGVEGDTIDAGEVLELRFHALDPYQYDFPATSFVSGLTFTLDNVAAGEDFVVVLQLADPNNPGTILTTRTIVVGADDIYRQADSIPEGFGAPALDGDDGFVIIEPNDYLQGSEGFVIVGAQVMSSTNGLSGSGIDLNRAVGDDGGSSGSIAFGEQTDDADVVTVTDIGVIRTVFNEQAISLDLSITVTDADGDKEIANFHINPFGDPIVLDMDGDGFHFQSLDSGVMYDMNGDGVLDQTAWIGAGDAILVRDANGNGMVDDAGEFIFHGEGMTDLQTLHALYGDVLDAGDTEFGQFGLWMDNGDGIFQTGEFLTLAEAGITDISLVSNGASDTAIGGEVQIMGTGTFNGGTGTLVDAAFRFQQGARPAVQRTQEVATIAAAAAALTGSTAAHAAPFFATDHMVNLEETGRDYLFGHDLVRLQPEQDAQPAAQITLGKAALTSEPEAAMSHHTAEQGPDLAASLAAQPETAATDIGSLGTSSEAAAAFDTGHGATADHAASGQLMEALLQLAAQPAAVEAADQQGEQALGAVREALAEVTGNDAISHIVDQLIDSDPAGAQGNRVDTHAQPVEQGAAANDTGHDWNASDIAALLNGQVAGAGHGAAMPVDHGDDAALLAAAAQ